MTQTLNLIKSFSGAGILKYNDNADFELHMDGGKVVNITGILDEAYGDNILVYAKIIKALESRIIFEEDGKLCKKLDSDGVLSYHICGMNLDHLLFYNTDDIIDITIEVKVRDRERQKYGEYSKR